MSSNNKEYPNDGLSSYSDIRLAYYIYTWDNNNKLKQKTAWSTIGTYSINSNNDIIYTSNKNQLLKTNGSNGVSIVKDTYGVIVNDNADVAPTILKINGTYIVGLDNIDGTVSPHTLHTTIPTIDSHLLANTNGINGNNYEITYTDMWASNIAILKKNNFATNNYFYPFTPYDKGTVIEPVELAVIGKESNGINGITNKGFIYNNYTYKRNVNLINYYNELYNYFKDWRHGSNKLSISFSNNSYVINDADDGSSTVTILTDFDISVIQNAADMFHNIYNENIGIDRNDSNFNALLSTCSSLTSIANQINVLLENYSDDGSQLLQTPLTYNLLESSVTALACWSYAKNIESLWGSKTTAIVMEKLTANSELFDFTGLSNATSIIGMNNRTSQWVELQLPIYDQTYEIIMEDIVSSKKFVSGTYSLASLSDFINQYTITFNNNLTENNLSTSTSISIIYSTGANIYSDDFNKITVFTYNNEKKTFEWTSYSYFLQNDNFNNSASTFRFIGIDSSGEKPFKNNQGRNTIKLTGFNKILLNDLYENPNTYQNADITYYYYIGDDTKHSSSTSDINKIIGRVSSYTVSLTSASKIDQNVLIGGCGSDGEEHTRGSPGFFYIPLPSDIDMNDNSAYVDTHWMLTTWTPNISKNAKGRGIRNNQDVLYKYTKMNDIITTGLYGGFTPYYNPNNNTTAGIIRIPQISYGESNYGSPIYVTGDENQIAKLSKIMFSSNAVTFPNNGQIKFYNYKEDDSNSYIFIGNETDIGTGGNITVTPIGNIPPNIISTGDTPFEAYFNNYKQFAACVFTLNSNEKNIILQNNLMNNNNVAYLDLIGYPDEEFDNLSFDVERKYIFTFNAHIQVTNLNLMSDQINYGTPSLLLVGHFRNRYCKANLPVEINGVTTNMIYSGRDIFIPLLNKPLENPVNNIYNVEGTYILSWNTTGNNINEFNDISKYAMYIPKNAKTYTTTGSSTFEQIYNNLFNESLTTTTTNLAAGNVLHFENVLDRIYAFILTGETVNNNFMYQFVNNTTYQDNSNKILSNDDIDLITGRINGSRIFNTSCSYDSNNHKVAITITSGDTLGSIECILVDDVKEGTNYVFNKNNIKLNGTYASVTSLTPTIDPTSNSVLIKLEKKEENATTPLNGINITVNLIKDKDKNISVECYDNHLSFDFNTGVDSGILGINEPMLSMTIQRY